MTGGIVLISYDTTVILYLVFQPNTTRSGMLTIFTTYSMLRIKEIY